MQNTLKIVVGPIIVSLAAVVLATIATKSLQAADVIHRRDEPNVSGTVVGTSREGATLERRGQKVEIPANVIESIDFDGEPPTLRLGRGAESNGNLSVALGRYEDAAAALENPRAIVKAEIEFLLARCRAKLARTDATELSQAAALLEAFRANHPTSYHYYALHEWLGKVYARQGDAARAKAAFETLGEAPWRAFQWRADVEQGRLLIEEKRYDEALQRFGRVLGASPESPAEQLGQQEALLAKGQCLAAQGSYDEAEKLLQDIIDEAPPEEAAVQAVAHGALGDVLRAAGKPKDALLAYLYVDLVVPSEPEAHAKSLYYIAELFGQLGQQSRADEVRERLKRTYPKSTWAQP